MRPEYIMMDQDDPFMGYAPYVNEACVDGIVSIKGTNIRPMEEDVHLT